MPIFMMKEMLCFAYMLTKRQHFAPSSHATIPSPQILPVDSWGLCRTSPENPFPGRAQNKGSRSGPLDHLVDQSPLSCTRGLNQHALSRCPSGLLTQMSPSPRCSWLPLIPPIAPSLPPPSPPVHTVLWGQLSISSPPPELPWVLPRARTEPGSHWDSPSTSRGPDREEHGEELPRNRRETLSECVRGSAAGQGSSANSTYTLSHIYTRGALTVWVLS